jgi:hypothetical protein
MAYLDALEQRGLHAREQPGALCDHAHSSMWVIDFLPFISLGEQQGTKEILSLCLTLSFD